MKIIFIELVQLLDLVEKRVSISFITSDEMERITSLEKTYETQIIPLPKTFMDYL